MPYKKLPRKGEVYELHMGDDFGPGDTQLAYYRFTSDKGHYRFIFNSKSSTDMAFDLNSWSLYSKTYTTRKLSKDEIVMLTLAGQLNLG